VPKKNRLQPWRTERFGIPAKDRARFVARMEHVLDTDRAAYDDGHVLIGMDEAAKALRAGVEPARPMAPGVPRREDHHYQRRGVRAIFCFVDPLRGWRRVTTRDSRTRLDWAEEVRHLLDREYPRATTVTLVCDNRNTHGVASLYQAFPASEAGRLAARRRLVHTPRNGSWLNLAEVQSSALTRQCVGRRFDSAAAMDAAMTAWQAARNEAKAGAVWRFTTADARVKLRGLYPVPDNIG
jgi:hypothetical protein